MRFTVEFEVGNDAFVHEEFMGALAGEVSTYKVAVQLRQVVDALLRVEPEVASGLVSGVVRDVNGNTVGSWGFV